MAGEVPRERMIKPYVDNDGKFVGYLDSIEVQGALSEVTEGPPHIQDTYINGQWACTHDLCTEQNLFEFARALLNSSLCVEACYVPPAIRSVGICHRKIFWSKYKDPATKPLWLTEDAVQEIEALGAANGVTLV
jgi:hypothetical protein